MSPPAQEHEHWTHDLEREPSFWWYKQCAKSCRSGSQRPEGDNVFYFWLCYGSADGPPPKRPGEEYSEHLQYIEDYVNITDDELFNNTNHINNQSDVCSAVEGGDPRSLFLNENTTGWIHLDVEKFINLNFISDENPPDPSVSEER